MGFFVGEGIDLSTALPATQEFVRDKLMDIVPYTLHMNYSHWNYDEIISAILPVEMLDDVPGAFSQSGHLAHLNLRSAYLPFKHLVAQVLLDKNPQIKTVVNKVDDVGASSVFRTFPMELLAGENNTVVTVKEADCVFVFDFAKVYWNTRLAHEHERIVAKFQPGEVVADVMAGVGPFAIPAGKKEVFVWANDLNPESYSCLQSNIERNKVQHFVSVHNDDGRNFIRQSIKTLFEKHKSPISNPVTVPPSVNKTKKRKNHPLPPPFPDRKIPLPPTFAHFVMNLPASAVEFLGAFIGAYSGLEHIFNDGKIQMPMIHVHTFHRESLQRGAEYARSDICAEVSKYLKYPKLSEQDIELVDVRRVAPSKVMYCASFRLPIEVAFAKGE
jgi:tRNA (guanine37-N1)-methyltransferase